MGLRVKGLAVIQRKTGLKVRYLIMGLSMDARVKVRI